MRKTIRYRLTCAFVGLAVGPLVLVGVLLIWHGFVNQRQQALDLQQEIARRVSLEVSSYLNGLVRGGGGKGGVKVRRVAVENRGT